MAIQNISVPYIILPFRILYYFRSVKYTPPVWSGLQTHLVLTPSNVLINCIINTLVQPKHEMWQTSLDSKHCKKYSCAICLAADYLIHVGKTRKVSFFDKCTGYIA